VDRRFCPVFYGGFLFVFLCVFAGLGVCYFVTRQGVGFFVVLQNEKKPYISTTYSIKARKHLNFKGKRGDEIK